jgi:hypothetical protein
MAKVTPLREQYQPFVEELQESFWAIWKPGRSGRGSGFSTM